MRDLNLRIKTALLLFLKLFQQVLEEKDYNDDQQDERDHNREQERQQNGERCRNARQKHDILHLEVRGVHPKDLQPVFVGSRVLIERPDSEELRVAFCLFIIHKKKKITISSF